MTLLVATRNPGKLGEIRRLLEPEGIEVLGLADLADAPEVDEDADSFLGVLDRDERLQRRFLRLVGRPTAGR